MGRGRPRTGGRGGGTRGGKNSRSKQRDQKFNEDRFVADMEAALSGKDLIQHSFCSPHGHLRILCFNLSIRIDSLYENRKRYA